MITEALRKLHTLEFNAARYEPAFDIGVRKYGSTIDFDFQIGISGNGFEATRNLTRDDLIEIRDWINEALVASSESSKTSAEAAS